MTEPGLRTGTLELHALSDSPGRNLPTGMLFEVADVLAFHGLDAPITELLVALHDVINKTPVEQGGRLMPDGSVDR